jgi:formylglycine-generating enzyme required for sulfatase activity
MIPVPAGPVELGQVEPGAFGWDNEFQSKRIEVPAFRISKYKVTNGDYLDFVRSGATPIPFFWAERGGRYYYRGMFAEIPLPLDWPVYCTHEEAAAYAQAQSMSLPSEEQFQRALSIAGPQSAGNFDFRRWDPEPVTAVASPAARVEAPAFADGPAQLIGNGWEWTSTTFAPFPGFEPFPFYQNYSEPFFDGAHFVLKGASPRTAGRLARPSFRNWFRPSYPYIYATFRMIES